MAILSYVDPLIPLHENIPAKLTRLSLNIATLTGLIDAAQHRRLEFLAAMFARSRRDKINQVRACTSTPNPGA